ncbi:GAF domain-containing protein [Methylorubrum sp. SB2]|uniref:GAF domain-containing protein n=1 Tax=Methylorubrum subtropicum TaxID=3138812 RepID=UPI00313B840E
MGYPTLNEDERLSFLTELQILDTPEEPVFDRIVQAARDLFGTPYALIDLIDRHRAWMKAGSGHDREVAREDAFCNYTILHDSVMVVPDARANPTFRNNRFVQGEPYVRFYAGAPLTVAPGIRVGALCIIDTKPRQFDAREMRLLTGLAQLVVDEMWLKQVLAKNATEATRELHRSIEDHDHTAHKRLSGAQIRAARALLNWSISELAAASNLSVNTIKRMEARTDITDMRSLSFDTLCSALELAGISFQGSSGVALKSSVN